MCRWHRRHDRRRRRRPRELLASLRPQIYAKGSPNKVVDPIVEPLWVGVRTLAAVDDAGAAMVDADGACRSPTSSRILRGLAEAAVAEQLADRRLRHQAGRPDAAASTSWSDDLPSMSTMFGLRRNRAGDAVKLKEGALDDVTFEPGDEVRLVVDRPAVGRRRIAARRPAARASAAARERARRDRISSGSGPTSVRRSTPGSARGRRRASTA